jgi:hypothetical protein
LTTRELRSSEPVAERAWTRTYGLPWARRSRFRSPVSDRCRSRRAWSARSRRARASYRRRSRKTPIRRCLTGLAATTAANYARVPLEPRTHRAPEFPRLSSRRQVDSRATSQALGPAPSAEAESQPQMMLIPESRSKGQRLQFAAESLCIPAQLRGRSGVRGHDHALRDVRSSSARARPGGLWPERQRAKARGASHRRSCWANTGAWNRSARRPHLAGAGRWLVKFVPPCTQRTTPTVVLPCSKCTPSSRDFAPDAADCWRGSRNHGRRSRHPCQSS